MFHRHFHSAYALKHGAQFHCDMPHLRGPHGGEPVGVLRVVLATHRGSLPKATARLLAYTATTAVANPSKTLAF